ncbi:hypothetical protein M0M57_09680 [Flavobacterium azooxidireducens]|uniref:Prenyltransferase n=1 Tax=Flavobacterium azooxidireducens TaxID=1871076 RepID=A0ABY4KAS6_9FLAO|nr:hypothetical protein [Flavobacterium azooxidireducens]UPQ77901.1 hypothetical protein M0M57_09680 [Flavobacterium azooxidireducens]
MKIFKNILDFYIQSSLHIAVAIFSLVRITEISLQLSNDTTLELTIFFGTIVGYNFLKYFEAFQKGNFDLNKNRYLVGLTFLSAIATLFYFLQLNNSLQIYFIKIGLLVVLYPFLRKFGFWKLFLVSFCVTAITVYAPIIQHNAFSDDEKIILFQRFLIVISLMIPFEILDSETDDKTLKTIPQRFGVFKAKLFGISLLVSFVFLEFFKDKIEISNFAVAIITALFIGFTTFKRDKYYTSFWVESVPIIWLVLLF